MPRPGPRPYECVRRAWHSDRHQPMRGSIIQQIFRLVTDAHGPATKKNKEWQEKLPIVVLKAEEILYSKANSEDEYTNPDTLWDRVNDAVDTIIRRDQSTETGEFLPPCVEAALNLGCVPVRASRSQRHSNPRTYLRPRSPEPPLQISDRTTNAQCPQVLPLKSVNHQLDSAARSTTAMNVTPRVTESYQHTHLNSKASNSRGHPPLYESIHLGADRMMRPGASESMKLGSVYPLYYGTNIQAEQFLIGPRVSEHADAVPVIVGRPVSVAIPRHAERGRPQNIFSHLNAELVSKHDDKASSLGQSEKPPQEDCDLSLRLGLCSDPRTSATDRRSDTENANIGSGSFDGGGSSGLYAARNKEFCFFPQRLIDDSYPHSLNIWRSEETDHNLEETIRKRKAPISDDAEYSQLDMQQELLSDQFLGQIERSGS